MQSETKIKELPESSKFYRTNVERQVPNSEPNLQSIIVVERDKLQIIIEEIFSQIVGAVVTQIRQESLLPCEVLTTKQLAEFLQVSTQSILNWCRRKENENPLPVRYAGADPRFYKSEIDAWSLREAAIQLSPKKNSAAK